MRRAFFGLVWSVVFIFIAALVDSSWAMHRAGGDPAKQQLATAKAGRESGPMVVFGSIGLAAVLSVAGKLPGTAGRRQRCANQDEPQVRPNAQPEVRPIVQPEARPMAPPYSNVEPSRHTFSFLGYVSRWDRLLVVVPVLTILVAFLAGGPPSRESLLGAVLFIGILGTPTLFLAWRYLAIRWAQVDSTGVAWGGLFGSHHREWWQIQSVTREALVENHRFHTHRIQVKFEGGGSVQFDQALTGFDTLAGTIQAVASELILPRKWEELHQKGEAKFGQVKLRPDGIKMKWTFYSWERLRHVRIENGHLVLYRRIRPRPEGDKGVPLSAIPDYPVLLAMMREGGAPL